MKFLIRLRNLFYLGFLCPLILLAASPAQALIALPNAQCTLQGRWLIETKNHATKYIFVINEGTGGEKRFLMKSVRDPKLKEKNTDEKLVELRIAIRDDKSTSDSQATLMKFLGYVKTKEAKSYLPIDFSKYCIKTAPL